MAIWINSSEEFNKLVKRITTHFAGKDCKAVKRRDVEECIAPCFNYNDEHPVLINSLKRIPSTTKGFLAKRASDDFNKKVNEFASKITSACTYEEKRNNLIRHIIAGLATSKGSINALDPAVKAVFDSMHDSLLRSDHYVPQKAHSKIDIHTEGVVNNPFGVFEQNKKCLFNISWDEYAIDMEINVFVYLNFKYEALSIESINITFKERALELSVHDRSIVEAIMVRFIDPWIKGGAKPICMPENLGLSPATLNAVYRELMIN